MLLLLALACRSAPIPADLTVSLLPAELRGLSGLTVDETGRLWAVTERVPHLVPLRLEGDTVLQDGEPLRIAGWPEATDAESLTWLSTGLFALGTEPREADGRAADDVLHVRLQGDSAAVVDRRSLSYEPFAIRAPKNAGIEGLCATGGHLVAVAERVLTDGPRRAPAWWHHERTRYVEIPLTSDTGKLAALDCRAEADRIELRAIERHYAVVRLLGITLTDGPPEVRLLRDLAGLPGDPNLEGLAWLPDGRIVLVADNSSGELLGPGAVTAVVLAAP